MKEKVIRGDIYYANLDGSIGSEQSGTRPVIIVQNNRGNMFSPTTIVLPITKKINFKTEIPTHLDLSHTKYLEFDSIILAEQIRTLDKKRLIKKIGHINDFQLLQDLNKKISIALDIKN